MVKKITKEELTKALYDLGSSAPQVAASLAKEGISGVKTGPECPIKAYLGKKFPEAGIFSMGNIYIIYWEGMTEGEALRVEVPFPIKEFIFQFDRGHYPELVKTY
jgi:hypothetical protein